MKRLTLLRHGHAQAHAEGGDFHRELDVAGRAEVQRSATAILGSFESPSLVLASAAERTRQSAAIVIEHAASLGRHLPLTLERRLYHASWRELLELVSEVPTSIEHLLLVGHNPGISEVAVNWASRLPGHDGFRGFATAGWCSARFDSPDWSSSLRPVELSFGS